MRVEHEEEPQAPLATLRRGLALSPGLRQGLPLTIALGVAATGGRVAVPVVIQRAIDDGLGGGGPIDLDGVTAAVLVAGAAVLVTTVCASLMYRRLATATEHALSALRRRTFAHLHDQAALTQAAQQRGALVARVTDDIDQISLFMQWGGVGLLVNVGQVLLATVAMALYSPVLTVVVVGLFVPYVLVLRAFQARLSTAYDRVRGRVGDMLSAVAETVVAAPVIRAYGVRQRSQARIDRSVDAHYRARFAAVRTAALMYSTGELVAAIATAAVIVVGITLGVGDGGGLGSGITAGSLVAYLFLVSLFVGPVQVVTEVLDQAQTAISGWRRVLQVLDTPTDVADPGPEGVDLPEGGPLEVCVEDVVFTYPGADRPALRGVDLRLAPGTVTAVVGETGSGKSTLGRLLVRLADPTAGRITVGGVPLPEVRFASLRRRVLLVPQDGFLFDTTIGENVGVARHARGDGARHARGDGARHARGDGARHARGDGARHADGDGAADVRAAFASLDLTGWLEALPAGLDTPVGERGTALSAGERQLVSLARAALADPDVLVLDEATSAVDPATEVQVAHALERLLEGRTAVIIAHRLSTAERADRVVVIDDGRVVEEGSHDDLLSHDGAYARLHAQWRRSTGTAA